MKYKNGILNNNSEIQNNFYNTISRNLWDKMIKRDIYLKSVKFMRKEFCNQLYFWNDDDTLFFGLLHTAETYGFLEQIGYLYVQKNIHSKNWYNLKYMNLIFRSVFNNMKYFYLQSANNTLEKYNLAFKYFYKNYEYLLKYIPYVTEGFDFILCVFDLYLNSSFFSNTEKMKLNYMKSKIIKRAKDMRIIK